MNSDGENERKRLARSRGLPETASYREINVFDAEIERKRLALARGLPETATYRDINVFDAQHQ